MPPKRLFGNWSSDFVEKRRGELEVYMRQLITFPDTRLQRSPALVEFLPAVYALYLQYLVDAANYKAAPPPSPKTTAATIASAVTSTSTLVSSSSPHLPARNAASSRVPLLTPATMVVHFDGYEFSRFGLHQRIAIDLDLVEFKLTIQVQRLFFLC
jgi:hypothetical protein